MCRIHHKIIDDKPEVYTVEVLDAMKRGHEATCGRALEMRDRFMAKILVDAFDRATVIPNAQSVVIAAPGANVTIRTARMKVETPLVPGTVGFDRNSHRYIRYLIDRYNEFAAPEPSRARKFSHGAVSRNIKSKFYSDWKLVPIEKFPALCTYLYDRIGKTRIAKLNRSKGYSSYKSFEEFLSQ